MRVRATAAVFGTAAGLLLAPFAVAADAVTTTSTVVAYIADTNGDGNGELWTRPADGTGLATKVFTSANDVWLPALSPDGTKVAYIEDRSSVDDYDYRLYVRNTDGSGTATKLSDGDVLSAPSWSFDGSKVVYSQFDWVNGVYGVYHVPATGGAATLVPTTDDVFSDEPSFAPSGEVVAVDAISDEGAYVGIDLVNLATGQRARVAGTAGGSDPVWSPDGQYLLFQVELAGCGVGLYRVPATGGPRVTIRENPGYFVGSAEYSRDGSQIFWNEVRRIACNPGAKAGEIYVANPDGSGLAAVTATTSVVEYATSVAGGTPLAPDTVAPAAPQIAAVGTVTATTAKVSWTAGNDAIDFVVLRKPQGDPAPTSMSDGMLVYHGPAHSATAGGLATGSVHDFYVFAGDSWGNDSLVSAAHPAKPTAPPVMSALPRIGTGTTGTAFTVKWTGTSPEYTVQVGSKTRGATGTWSSAPAYATLAGPTSATQVAFNGAQARTYYFRAQGTDGFGNLTPFSAAPSVAHVPLNESWTGFTYSSGWSAKASSTRYLGTYKTTITPNASVSARVETSRFVLIGDKCSTCGAFKVYVDGVHKATIDTRASTTLVRQVLYASGSYTSVKAHTIKIVAVGTSGRPRVSIDGLALSR